MTQGPEIAVDAQCPETSFVVALMHSPDTLRLAKRVNIALAGHTHGGQINIPIIGRRVTATKLGKDYAYGLKTFSGFPVYITSGIGTSMLPARFRSPPEIAVIEIL